MKKALPYIIFFVILIIVVFVVYKMKKDKEDKKTPVVKTKLPTEQLPAGAKLPADLKAKINIASGLNLV